MNVSDLLEMTKAACGAGSDAELARKLGVTRAAVSGWRHNSRLPDTVTCAKMSEITGVPLGRVLGVVGEARAISREEKAVWRRLANVAATLVLALSALPLWAGNSGTHAQAERGNGYALCAMVRKMNGRLRRVLRREAWGHTVAA